jgi:hypothetical protein
VHPEGSEELMSGHRDFASGWQAGTHVVTVEDKENAYSLFAGERRVARFGHSRLRRRVEGVEQLLSKMVGAL